MSATQTQQALNLDLSRVPQTPQDKHTPKSSAASHRKKPLLSPRTAETTTPEKEIKSYIGKTQELKHLLQEKKLVIDLLEDELLLKSTNEVKNTTPRYEVSPRTPNHSPRKPTGFSPRKTEIKK